MSQETRREKLQGILENLQTQANETPHVYYDPPESLKLVYPCFVYHYVGQETLYSNDNPYLKSDEYTVTYITKKADPLLPEAIIELPYVQFSNHYTAENLHHFMFVFRSSFYNVEPRLEIQTDNF